MEFKDYYQIMGVARDVSPEDLKRTYRKLARKYHPDVSKEPDAEERFKEVQEAYEVLKDPEKRAAYDQLGAQWKAGADFRPPPDWEPDVGFGPGGFTGAEGFSDFFESLFGAHGRGAPRGRTHVRMRGEDVHARVRITLEDAYAGATRSLVVRAPEIDASGRVVNRERTLSVRIPRGVTEGQRIRLAGLGGPGIGGAPAGDLYLDVQFEPHPLFHPERRDVVVHLPVAPWEAALGRTVTVPTLGGPVGLKIPPGSRTGTRLRLRGRGLPGNPPGDQYVVLEIALPPADSAAARALYEQMEREMPFDPRADLARSREGAS